MARAGGAARDQVLDSLREGLSSGETALQAIRDGVLHDLAAIDPAGLEIHILQADCVPDAEYVRDEIKKAYPQVGRITITGLGVVIGAHCGPGLLTVFYLCAGRQPT